MVNLSRLAPYRLPFDDLSESAEGERYDLNDLNGLNDFSLPGYFMNCRCETAKMAESPGNRPAVPRDWSRGVPERYVAGADSR